MACIKGVNRSASVALSPDAPYMAAGTMAGAVDLSFSSSANIEIFKLDFQSDDRELQLVGESPSSERFDRLAWGRNGSGSEDFSLGLIAGGLVDGSIDVWNPLALIGSQASGSALVGHLSRHKGPVRGLEFNSIAPNLLASGADDGEICIWDLAKPTEPSHFPPLKGSGSASQGEISFLSWNSKVQHILASTSYNGTTVVWDLKKQKPVISFADSVRRRCSVLQWNPDMATQLIVASDEDDSPSLRLWDMRNVITPVKEFAGHTKGVIAMAWCPTDSSYLLSCAKDNRTICWDTVTAEIVCELPAGTNGNFDVHWYPKIPGVISTSSFDGKIGICNIEGCSRYGAGDNYSGCAPLRAPKWYKRPVGASFGFGGKLISFQSKASAGNAASVSEVLVHDLVTEESLVTRSAEFESAIENGQKPSLRALCDMKSQTSHTDEEREIWGFLRVMFEEDGTARSKLLAHLGFSIPTTEQDNLTSEVDALQVEDTVAGNQTQHEASKGGLYAMDNGEDFFNNLPSPKAESPMATSANNSATVDPIASAEEMSQQLDEPEEFEDTVQRALVVGDYKGAVAQCITANRMADALVIAHVGGPSLWECTRDQYLKMSRAPYMKVVSAMVKNDLATLVNSRPLKFWKETLGLLCTFAEKDEWTTLCDMLASKLMATGDTLAATLCYICAGNIDKTVEIWSRSLTTEQEGKSYVDLLQDLMEKTIILVLATGQKRFSAAVCKLVENYAELLASQGLLTVAMNYLKLLDSVDLSPELAILKDRLALSIEPEKESGNLDMDNSISQNFQQYYQEGAPEQMQSSIPASPYDNNYQQSYHAAYGGDSLAPAPYPNVQPRSMFTPTPPLTQQGNFGGPVAQPPSARTPFVPSTPATEQYQQPTLASQLYPGSINPPYPTPAGTPAASQFGQVPAPRMPQVMSPALNPVGFVPVTSPGVAERPNFVPSQPAAPTQPAPAQVSVTPAAPPPTVQTADTSKVPAHQKPIISSLTRLYKETSDALGGPRANPAKKREIEDNSKKLGALFSKLNSGDVSKNVADKLALLCQALDSNDLSQALQIQMNLTNTDWDECNFWLATVKRMIKTRQSLR